MLGVVRRHEARDVDEVAGLGQLPGARVGSHARKAIERGCTPGGCTTASMHHVQNCTLCMFVRDSRMTLTVEPDSVEIGLRERKKRETRDRLRSVALRLAVEHGVDHVTVEDIAAAADVSTRTFFNYFGSKEEVLVGPDPSSATDLARAFADRPAGESPFESVRALMLVRATLVAERADDIRARMALIQGCPALQPRYFATAAEMERVLIDAIAARTGTDPDVDPYPALLAGVASTVMRTTIVSWLAGQTQHSDRPLPDLIDEAFDQLAVGLAHRSVPARNPPNRTVRTSKTRTAR